MEDKIKIIAKEILNKDIFEELINDTTEWQLCFNAITNTLKKYI